MQRRKIFISSVQLVKEAIVNAVAHRNYDSTASVQVMLFKDRLEVWNPGTLPPELSIETLKNNHGSYPRNPLIADALYYAHYIERMGTGIEDIVKKCLKLGLPEPTFVNKAIEYLNLYFDCFAKKNRDVVYALYVEQWTKY